MRRTYEESRALFDRWSASYDSSVLTEGGPLTGYAESLAEAAAMLPVSEGDRILDVGIGTGSFGGLLAQRGARIWGVDISPRMLERCQEAYPDFTLAESSFLPLPFSEGSFEAVVASFAFHEVSPAERSAALAEVARVLVPGGRGSTETIARSTPR